MSKLNIEIEFHAGENPKWFTEEVLLYLVGNPSLIVSGWDIPATTIHVKDIGVGTYKITNGESQAGLINYLEACMQKEVE